MAKKIYISPSSQPANTYAVGNTNEQEQCRKIGAKLDAALKRCGFDSKVGLDGTMYTRVKESNNFGADAHSPVHTNAFNGKVAGTRIIISKRGGEAEELAKAILAELGPITPGESDNISVNNGLYEIYATTAICVYIEVGFHDEPEEAQWLINYGDEAAEAICRGYCNHYGVKYIPSDSAATPEEKPAEKPAETVPAQKPATNEMLYRVFDAADKQVGAYAVEANAFNAVRRELKDGGAARITYTAK